MNFPKTKTCGTCKEEKFEYFCECSDKEDCGNCYQIAEVGSPCKLCGKPLEPMQVEEW